MDSDRISLVPIIVFAMTVLLAGFPAVAAAGEDPTADSWAVDYERLTNWEFSTTPIPLPEGGISLQRDTAEWFFESGTVRPMRPTSDGTVTGLVFEGEGRFRMEVPDPVEVNQFPRFFLTPGETITPPETLPDGTIEYDFSRLVLRTTDDRVMALFPGTTDKVFLVNPLAHECHLRWLGHGRFDVDARVVAGLLNRDEEFLAIDMETAERGWLFYEFDPWRMEEIRLCRMPLEYDFVEVWISLDRAEHRRSDGRPGSIRTPLVDLVHADLEVDLMEHKGRVGKVISRGGRLPGSNMSLRAGGAEAGVPAASHPSSGRDNPYPLTRFRARMTFASSVGGLQALPLRLNPWAGSVTVQDAEGQALPVLRAPFTERFPRIIIHEEDTSTVVLLREPLARGGTVTLDFSWVRLTANNPGRHDPGPVYIEPTNPYLCGGGQDWYPPFMHSSGRFWYPEPLEGWNDRHTARVTIIHPEKLQVRGTGSPAGGKQEGKRCFSMWVSDTPIKSAAFSYGHCYTERRILEKGLPEVVAFGHNYFMQPGDEAEGIAALITDMIRFYQSTFDHHLPVHSVTCASIYGGSQSFSGFISLNSRAFNMDAPHLHECWLAMKTAELFWGDLLDWESYRDDWLIRALVDISAEMYMEATAEWNPKKKAFTRLGDKSWEKLFQRRYDSHRRDHWTGPLELGFRAKLPEMIRRRIYRFSMSFSSSGFDSSAPLDRVDSNLTSTAVRGSQASMATVRTNLGDCRFTPLPPWQRFLLLKSEKRREVLYMLRAILRNRFADGDERFNAILADFLNTCAGKPASTRLFIAAVEHNTNEDWDWFFDQWVGRSEVPTYDWAHTLSVEPEEDGKYRLEVWLQQSGVPEGFRMPVTFALEYEEADPELLHFEMDQPSKTFTVRLPNRPAQVIFDPYQDLLYVKE